MAKDQTLTEDDDDIEIVEVDKLPTAEEIAEREAAGAEDDHEGEDDDGEEDTRLAEHEDDEDPKRAKRRQRRETQKAARDRTLAELDALRRQVADLTSGLGSRLTAVETHTVGMTERQIADKLEETKRRVADFEAMMAKAAEDGNGTDMVVALRMRDEARDEARALETTAQQIKTNRETPKAAGANPEVVRNANAWKQANPWYDSRGVDASSALVNAIDNQLVAEKFDPATPGYWQELTRRVKTSLGSADDAGGKSKDDGKRKGPPVGGDRSAGSPGGRREVYVTPERKAAMVEAGIWGDPARRAKMLKTYREYDAQNSAR